MKALLPALREKKRYLVLEAVTDKPVAWPAFKRSVSTAALSYLGEKGCSQAGIQFLDNKWNGSRGMVRVNHTLVDDFKAAMTFISSIDKQKAIVRTVGASGMIKKAEEKYLRS